jgi:general stress protein 26
MSRTISESEKRCRLKDLMADFDTAMLVTRTPDGILRSRPLAIARSREDSALYFSTAIDSTKVNEISADPHVNLTMQDKRRFISLSGIAHVEVDRELVRSLWLESWRIWFPQGWKDPSLAILVVEPTEATYWDISGAEGLRYLFESAKAYVTGARPDSDNDQLHMAHVKLSPSAHFPIAAARRY